MKKFLMAILLCILAVSVLQANTIIQDGVYVTVEDSYNKGHNGYGDYFTTRFSLSSNKTVRVHVIVTNSNGSVVKDTWVTLSPRDGSADAFFSGLSGGPYTVTLVQH